MISFENRIRIARPVEEVFAYVAHLENLSSWNYFVTEVTRTTAGAPGIGSRYLQVRKTDQQTLIIEELETNSRIGIRTTADSSPHLRRRIDFRVTNDSGCSETEILDNWDLDLAVPRVLIPLARVRVKRAVGENLRKLRELLEKGSVTLQDGRYVSLEVVPVVSSGTGSS